MRGKVCLRSKVERNDGDHPRLCGEKVQLGIQGLKRVGSPPPMRGKVLLYPLHVQF